MTKIVAIVGGPNKMKGYSGSMVEKVLKGAQNAGAETRVFSIYDYSIQACRACFSCSKKGKCVIDDDYPILQKALLDADGFILAAPNHMNSVPSQMKAFIDRSFSYLYHCQTLKGRYAVTVMSSGGPELMMAEDYLANIIELFGCFKVGDMAATEGQFKYTNEEEVARIMEESTLLGTRLVQAIENKETFKKQVDRLDEVFESIGCLVVLEKKLLTFENQYWKDHYGLKEEDYY